MNLFSEACHQRLFASSALKISSIIKSETYKWESWLQSVPGALWHRHCGRSQCNQLNLCRGSWLPFCCTCQHHAELEHQANTSCWAAECLCHLPSWEKRVMLLESIINGEEVWSFLLFHSPATWEYQWQLLSHQSEKSSVALQCSTYTCSNTVLERMAGCVICLLRKYKLSLEFILTLPHFCSFSHIQPTFNVCDVIGIVPGNRMNQKLIRNSHLLSWCLLSSKRREDMCNISTR